MSDFNYKQRPATKEWDENWDRVFLGKRHYEPLESHTYASYGGLSRSGGIAPATNPTHPPITLEDIASVMKE